MGMLVSWQVLDEFWARVELLIPKHRRDPQKQCKYKSSAAAANPLLGKSGIFSMFRSFQNIQKYRTPSRLSTKSGLQMDKVELKRVLAS